MGVINIPILVYGSFTVAAESIVSGLRNKASSFNPNGSLIFIGIIVGLIINFISLFFYFTHSDKGGYLTLISTCVWGLFIGGLFLTGIESVIAGILIGPQIQIFSTIGALCGIFSKKTIYIEE